MTSAGSPISASGGRTCRRRPTSATTRPSSASARSCAQLATAGDIADSAYNPLGRSAKEILDQAEAKVPHIAEQGARGQQQFAVIGALLADVVDRIETLFNRDNPSDVTGVPTGFTDLDRMTSGLQPGDLWSSPAGRAWARPRWRSISASTSRSVAALPVGGVLDGNGRHAAGHAHARHRRKARPAQAAHRAPRRRGLAAADRCCRQAQRRADPYRRDAGAELDRTARARAPPASGSTASSA